MMLRRPKLVEIKMMVEQSVMADVRALAAKGGDTVAATFRLVVNIGLAELNATSTPAAARITSGPAPIEWDDLLAPMRSMVDAGLSRPDIAKRLGVSTTALSEKLRHLGIATKGKPITKTRRPISPELRAKMLAAANTPEVKAKRRATRIYTTTQEQRDKQSAKMKAWWAKKKAVPSVPYRGIAAREGLGARA